MKGPKEREKTDNTIAPSLTKFVREKSRDFGEGRGLSDVGEPGTKQ